MFTARHHRQSLNRSLFIETEICDFRRDRDRAACSAPLRKPVGQLDDVHSVLRLNYETLRGLISLASPSVAKPTDSETSALLLKSAIDPAFETWRMSNCGLSASAGRSAWSSMPSSALRNREEEWGPPGS